MTQCDSKTVCPKCVGIINAELEEVFGKGGKKGQQKYNDLLEQLKDVKSSPTLEEYYLSFYESGNLIVKYEANCDVCGLLIAQSWSVDISEELEEAGD